MTTSEATEYLNSMEYECPQCKMNDAEAVSKSEQIDGKNDLPERFIFLCGCCGWKFPVRFRK